MNRVALFLALLAVVAPTFAAAPGDASPQPSPICGYCGGTFERAADERGVNATVATSRVTVQVHENGSATWTVRNRLTNGIDQFGDDRSRLTDVARSLAASSRGVGDDASFVSAELEGNTTVLVYRDSDAAERHAGLLVVDYLHHGGYERWYGVNVEAFTIRGPEGTVVANDPASGQVDEQSVTWTGETAEQAYRAPQLDDYPYVVFGPDRPVLTSARAAAVLVSLSAPRAASNALPFVVVTSPVFTVALWLVGAVVRRRGPTVGTGQLATLVAVPSGGLVVALAFGYDPGAAEPVALFSGPALFGLLVGGIALRPDVCERLRTPRQQVFAAAAALAAIWIALSVLYAGTGDGEAPVTAFRSVALALPFAAMVPLGSTLDGDGHGTVGWMVAGGLAFAVMLPLAWNFATPMGALFVFFGLILFPVAAVVFAVVGSPLLLLGWRLAEDSTGERTVPRRQDDL